MVSQDDMASNEMLCFVDLVLFVPIAPPWVDKQLGWVGAEPGRVHFGRISTSSPLKK